jgi:endonuclease/exonuclease/phosphatase family metal-dependent hydrolase
MKPGRVGAAVALRIACLLWLLAVLAIAVARRWSDSAWVELARFLPYYWIVVPGAVLTVLAAWRLGRAWPIAGLAGLAVHAFASMGPEWNSGDAALPGGIALRVMTYNIKAGTARERHGGLEALNTEVARHAPDLVLTQDADSLLATRDAQPLHIAFGPAVFGLPHVFALGQYVVASRHPIRGCHTRQMEDGRESHRFLVCDIDVDGVSLSVVNLHLHTPRGGLIAARHEGLEGASEWQRNVEARLAQARSVAQVLPALPRPLIVAGDMNAAGDSPVVRLLMQAAELRDTFDAAGRGFGYTYGHSMRWGLAFLRIDHILVSPRIAVLSSTVGGGAASEHRPVVADLMLRPPVAHGP